MSFSNINKNTKVVHRLNSKGHSSAIKKFVTDYHKLLNQINKSYHTNQKPENTAKFLTTHLKKYLKSLENLKMNTLSVTNKNIMQRFNKNARSHLIRLLQS